VGWFLIFLEFLVFFCVSLPAKTINVFLASGQSNAKEYWSSGIEDELNNLSPNKNIVIVKSIHSGAKILDWWDDGPQALYYEDLSLINSKIQEIILEGNTPVFKGLFWFQGEGDTISYDNMDLYKERFISMINQFQYDTNSSELVTILNAVDTNQDPYYDNPENVYFRTREHMDYMRKILFDLGDELNGFTMDTRFYNRYDAWHIYGTDLKNLGIATAERYHLEYDLKDNIEIYLLAGQSNAKPNLANAIERELNLLNPNKSIIVVNSHHPGDWLLSWWDLSTGAGENCYRDISLIEEYIQKITDVNKSPIFKGIIWFQGEGDSGSYNSMQFYKEKFKNYINYIQNYFSAGNNFELVINLIDGNPDPYYDNSVNLGGRTRDQINYMRNILSELSSELNALEIDTRSFARTDAWHIDNSEFASLGEYTAEKIFFKSHLKNYNIRILNIENGESLEIFFEAPINISNWKIKYTKTPCDNDLLNVTDYILEELTPGSYILKLKNIDEDGFFRIFSP